MTFGVPAAFVPVVALTRTDAERTDQHLSWQRDDAAFFASGACHVLAFRFMQRHRHDGFHVVALQPESDPQGRGFGSHVYAADGTWAFDFNGWTPESALLAESAKACRAVDPGWTATRHVVHPLTTLDEFCRQNPVRHPRDFAFDPIPRADAYLDRFPPHPPTAPLTAGGPPPSAER